MSEKSQGFEEYTPSRLEWLVVMLNSHVHYMNTLPGEHVQYVYALGDGNTIIMRMRHYADLSPENVNSFVDSGKEFAMSIAESYNWYSWLNIQVMLDPIDRPTKNT